MVTFWSKNRCKDTENFRKLQINVTFSGNKLHKNATFAMRKLHKYAIGAQHKYYVSVISTCQCSFLRLIFSAPQWHYDLIFAVAKLTKLANFSHKLCLSHPMHSIWELFSFNPTNLLSLNRPILRCKLGGTTRSWVLIVSSLQG